VAPPGFRDSPHAALSSGEVIGSTYAIQHELVRTETGVVFDARDMLMDRQVALKLAWRDPGTPPLLAEARRTALVRDPCAAAVYGMGTHSGVNYLVGERVTGTLLSELADVRRSQQSSETYLARFRRLVAAVARAHEAGVAIGDLSGATILVDPATNRMVLGRLSLSQVPAFGPLGQILAPEVVRGEVTAADPAAAEGIDLYGLGCIAIELARGTPPFAAEVAQIQLRGHAYEPAPRLRDQRDDLPDELSDLVEALLAKHRALRPRSADDVLRQLDAITERLGMSGRSLRVLIVDDDTSRARQLWSLARRGHASAIVETASTGPDAAHKLNRDHPDLVFVEAGLRGVMNALELVMYARGLETDTHARIVLVGEIADGERGLFASAAVSIVGRADVADAVLDQVRTAVVSTEAARRRRPRRTITG
jgi:serine/threonine protein kinase